MHCDRHHHCGACRLGTPRTGAPPVSRQWTTTAVLPARRRQSFKQCTPRAAPPTAPKRAWCTLSGPRARGRSCIVAQELARGRCTCAPPTRKMQRGCRRGAAAVAAAVATVVAVAASACSKNPGAWLHVHAPHRAAQAAPDLRYGRWVPLLPTATRRWMVRHSPMTYPPRTPFLDQQDPFRRPLRPLQLRQPRLAAPPGPRCARLSSAGGHGQQHSCVRRHMRASNPCIRADGHRQARP